MEHARGGIRKSVALLAGAPAKPLLLKSGGALLPLLERFLGGMSPHTGRRVLQVVVQGIFGCFATDLFAPLALHQCTQFTLFLPG
jgi:hypothetical protein